MNSHFVAREPSLALDLTRAANVLLCNYQKVKPYIVGNRL